VPGRVSIVQAATPLRARGREAPAVPTPSVVPGRSLALVAQPQTADEERRWAPARGYAPFLAHLIAIRDDAPQLRARRRSDSGTAISRYGAAANEAATPHPHLVNRRF
jgi:hypothetical protein